LPDHASGERPRGSKAHRYPKARLADSTAVVLLCHLDWSAKDRERSQRWEKLIAARDREVEQRRNVADALAQAYERGETESMREVFINLQNTIDAIERAIQHDECAHFLES